MDKLRDWGREFWDALLKDDEAREAVGRMQRDALVVLDAAQRALTMPRKFSLLGAVAVVVQKGLDRHG